MTISKRAISRKVVAGKYNNTIAFASRSASVKVPKIPKDKLIQIACSHYNEYETKKPHWDGRLATPESKEFFLHRICVNYLRHEVSQYDKHLQALRGQVGMHDASIVLKEKALKAIGRRYEWLIEECDRQMEQNRRRPFTRST